MLIPGEVIWSFLIWTGETRTLVLRTDEELWKERLYSCVMTWFVYFPTQFVNLKKSFSTYFLWPSKNISLSNNVYSHVIKGNEKIRATRGAVARESKKHSPCGVAWGSKADTILGKSPGPFPCCLLTGIILCICVPFLVSWTISSESLEIYSLS